jgi:hypothetical protein
MQSFTSEDLLQYLYQETSSQQSAEIAAALANDWSLREKMDLLVATQKQLNSIQDSPRQQTIDQILSYAEKSMEELTQHA